MRLIPCLIAVLMAAPVLAQSAPLRVDINAGLMQPMPIAVPAFAPGNGGNTEAGTTTALGDRAAQVIAGDLRSSGLFGRLHHHGGPG
jgi:TolB protein